MTYKKVSPVRAALTCRCPRCGALKWDGQTAGVAAMKAGADPLTEATLRSIRRTRLALKGPLTTPIAGEFRSVNVRLLPARRRALSINRPTRTG
jgi:isocitrate dehydrogenase (NAD+)